jgi:histidine ammonia-lyase
MEEDREAQTPARVVGDQKGDQRRAEKEESMSENEQRIEDMELLCAAGVDIEILKENGEEVAKAAHRIRERVRERLDMEPQE